MKSKALSYWRPVYYSLMPFNLKHFVFRSFRIRVVIKINQTFRLLSLFLFTTESIKKNQQSPAATKMFKINSLNLLRGLAFFVALPGTALAMYMMWKQKNESDGWF